MGGQSGEDVPGDVFAEAFQQRLGVGDTAAEVGFEIGEAATGGVGVVSGNAAGPDVSASSTTATPSRCAYRAASDPVNESRATSSSPIKVLLDPWNADHLDSRPASASKRTLLPD